MKCKQKQQWRSPESEPLPAQHASAVRGGGGRLGWCWAGVSQRCGPVGRQPGEPQTHPLRVPQLEFSHQGTLGGRNHVGEGMGGRKVKVWTFDRRSSLALRLGREGAAVQTGQRDMRAPTRVGGGDQDLHLGWPGPGIQTGHLGLPAARRPESAPSISFPSRVW